MLTSLKELWESTVLISSKHLNKKYELAYKYHVVHSLKKLIRINIVQVVHFLRRTLKFPEVITL